MLDALLLSRIEDAGINASAPPEQRWLDGWLIRFSPGKAKRARCINALAGGRLPLDQRLGLAATLFAEAGLPMLVRITPFSQPPELDHELAQRGFSVLDDTRVMVCTRLPAGPAATDFASDRQWVALSGEAFAATVGELRGTPADQRSAHARRLESSPVPYRGYAIRSADGPVLACGQFAIEGDRVGIYDVFTRESSRGRGLAGLLCDRLLRLAVAQGACVAYLQVEADNRPARHIYQKLGFADGYAYHYRSAPAGA